jgi:protein-S-isoprenylcysteine O-methyltransferase Ste14
MPRLALALCILWFISLFVFRSVVQWKKTGSSGIKGFHGRIGSLPWNAGVAVSIGLALTPLAPIAALLDWPGGTLLVSHDPLALAGAFIALIGIAGALLAQLSMGNSWRIGVDPAETTVLVTTGLFAWIRNPIFTFIGLSMLGFVLLIPTPLSLLAGLLTLLGIEIQVHAVEEPYLQRVHGEVYDRYAAAVGRFVPRLGQLANR